MRFGKRTYWTLGLVAIFALVGMGVMATSGFASAGGPDNSPSIQACDQEDDADDASEAAKDQVDTDDIDEQCGDQNEATEAEDVDTQAEGQDDVQEPSYSGSITVDEPQYESLSEADEAAALQELATIAADQAKAAAETANPGTSAVEVELDNENGVVVYSVELSNGLDVKVDAGNGNVLHTEPGDD